MLLSFKAPERALVQPEKGLRHAADDIVRDGVIQRFEYSIDLSWKLIQRYLKQVAQLDESALRTKKALFREADRRSGSGRVEYADSASGGEKL